MHLPRIAGDADAWHLVIFFAIAIVLSIAFSSAQKGIQGYHQALSTIEERR